jgi:hypothetical protein
MADRLTRHAKDTAKFLLPDALSGGECTVGDCLDQLFVGPVDQRRLSFKRLHQAAVC